MATTFEALERDVAGRIALLKPTSTNFMREPRRPRIGKRTIGLIWARRWAPRFSQDRSVG
jgi:hypothetical protein